MKKSILIIAVIAAITLSFSSCKKDQIAHNTFQTVGDYSFEMLSAPNEYGDIDIYVKNIKGIGFDYYEEFNDPDRLNRYCKSKMYSPVFMPLMADSKPKLPTERTITIHRTSGLVILTSPKEDNPDTKQLAKIVPSSLWPDDKNTIFKSASNFFNIY